jgi:hypothetical protein
VTVPISHVGISHVRLPGQLAVRDETQEINTNRKNAISERQARDQNVNPSSV